MPFQDMISRSWIGRFRRAFNIRSLGIVLIISLVALLFWNEGRAIKTAQSIANGSGLVVSIAPTIDPNREGDLVHISGHLFSTDSVVDPAFGVEAQGVRLLRRVEMYQWIESTRADPRSHVGGGEEQTRIHGYAPAWSSLAQNSSQIRDGQGHQNPLMAVQNAAFQVDSAMLHDFRIDGEVLNLLDNARDWPIPADQLDAVQQAIGPSQPASLVDGGLYLGTDPRRPRIGDYRIHYQLVPFGRVSLIGRQTGNGIAPYHRKSGGALLIAREGALSADELLDADATSDTVLIWITRAAGLAMLIFGFSRLVGPSGDIVPFAGPNISEGTGVAAWIAGLLVGSIAIGVAWLSYRPLIGIFVLTLGITLGVAIRRPFRRLATGADQDLPRNA